MLTIFNRKELITALSAEQMFRVKYALSGAGIPHYTAALNRGGPFPSRQRGVFLNTDYLNQYRVYVHKQDYDRARGIIQSALEGR